MMPFSMRPPCSCKLHAFVRWAVLDHPRKLVRRRIGHLASMKFRQRQQEQRARALDISIAERNPELARDMLIMRLRTKELPPGRLRDDLARLDNRIAAG